MSNHGFRKVKTKLPSLRFSPSVPSPTCVLSHVSFALEGAESSQTR